MGYEKQGLCICCIQETQFRLIDIHRIKVKGWERVLHANRNQKIAGLAILISDKAGCNINTVIRDKEGYYIMIKGSIQGEAITIVNIYAPTVEAPKYIKKILMGSPKMAEE